VETLVIVANILFALAVVGLVLIQHGKGADAGAAFGSGASATVFGAQGASNFLSRTTAILAAGWFATTIVLAGFAINSSNQDESIMSNEVAPVTIEPTMVPEVPEMLSDVPVVPIDGDIPVVPVQDMDDMKVELESVPEMSSDISKALPDGNEVPVPDTVEASSDTPQIPE